MIHIMGPMGKDNTSSHGNQICIQEIDGDFCEEMIFSISEPVINKDMEVVIIDDGEKINIRYVDDKVYEIECNSTSSTNARGLYRVMIHNRHCTDRICDIKYLQLSVVTE